LVKTLPFHLPFIYLEGYRYCRKWVKQKWYKSKIRKIMTASGIEVNEPLKFITAELNKKGVKLIIFQHGGSYGSSRYNPIENIERQASDEYWSWGWGKQENGVRPMPNPKLSLLALRRRENSKTDKKYILFVGNAVPRYHCRTYSIPIANQGIQYLEWQISFVKELETNIRSKVVFRPFPIDYEWALRQRLQDTCPDLNRDDSNDYYARLVEASLVVCDMNQTTLLESLGANIPTIAFWNPHFWELRLSAKPYFKLLRDSGILHHTPQEAANAVNCIWPRVEDWWVQSEIQLARQRFVNRYALHSSGWIQKWCKALFLNV
jgi:putative transferase (TIGR04331 family)